MLRAQLRSGVAQVGLALREPEEFTRRWHGGEARYPWWVFLALAFTAILGTSTYGLTMGILGGERTILLDAVRCTTAAGLAWGIALPSLYIFNSLSGSRLKPRAPNSRTAHHLKGDLREEVSHESLFSRSPPADSRYGPGW
jgi:hypothetical protein